MPFFNDRMSHGNLIVVFDIEFPKKGSITQAKAEQLRSLLPGPNSDLKSKKDNVEFLDDFSEHDANTDPRGGGRKRGGSGDDDDDEDGPRGQRVECNSQ